MSTTPTPTPAPATITIAGGTTAEVLTILQLALNVLAVVPATAPEAAIGSLILPIITAAVQRITADTGKPIDMSKIPVEAPLA